MVTGDGTTAVLLAADHMSGLFVCARTKLENGQLGTAAGRLDDRRQRRMVGRLRGGLGSQSVRLGPQESGSSADNRAGRPQD